MIQSLEKAIMLLNAVASAGGWVGVRELSRMTGLKPPTAQQLLKTLQAWHYLEFDDSSRRYRVGIGALMLSHGIDSTARLGEFARPYIDTIFNATGETTVAFACDRGIYSNVCVRHCVKHLATSVPSEHDIANPHIMACGQALLAWQGAAAINHYIKLREQAGGTAELPEKLRSIRETGYAELINFNNSSVAAYGVPVFDVTGNAILSLGWSIPLSRFDGSIKDKILPMLIGSAKSMGEALNARTQQNAASSSYTALG